MIDKETLNKVHHNDFLDNDLPDKCANLILFDPPYFQTKGAFDWKWKTFQDYLKDVEKWAIECKRILADNGTLFWWGASKKIAYTQVIADKYFNLESNVTVRIINKQTNKIRPEDARCFINVTERLLMYSNGKEPNEWDKSGWDVVKSDVANFQVLRKYFYDMLCWMGETNKSLCSKLGHRKAEHTFYVLPKKVVIDKIGQSADHPFRYGSSQWCMPTLETYNQLIEVFNIDKWDGFIQYEDLRLQYEDLRRPFNPLEKYKTEVLEFNQSHNSEFDHPTKKPEKATRYLIQTCSKPKDLVVVPMSGSGTEVSMAAKEGRPFVGYDIEKKYVDMSNERAAKYLNNKQLSILDFV